MADSVSLYMIILIFLLGLSVGSFLNVVIDRLPVGKSIIRGRSHCDYCKHVLAPNDLIPVVSFFWLGRNCRYCGKKISWQYPIVELTAGLLFVFTYSFFAYNLLLFAYHLIIVSGLLAIFITDLKYKIIPDEVLAVLIAAALFYLLVFNRNQLIGHLLAGLIFFLLFLTIVAITRGRGMGLGDVKYAFVMGFLLGIPHSVVAFYLAFLTGAAVSLILVIAGKKTMKSTIPFGPYLSGATFISLFYGEALWLVFRKIIGL